MLERYGERERAASEGRPYKEKDRLAGAAAAVVELVFGDFAAERIAMNAEDFRGAGLVAIGAVEDALDETLFKFSNGLVEEDAALDHLQYQTF